MSFEDGKNVPVPLPSPSPPPPCFDNSILNHKRNENQFFWPWFFFFFSLSVSVFLLYATKPNGQSGSCVAVLKCKQWKKPLQNQAHAVWVFVAMKLLALMQLFLLAFVLLLFLLFCYMLLNLFTNTFFEDAISNGPRWFYLFYMFVWIFGVSDDTTIHRQYFFSFWVVMLFSLSLSLHLSLTDWLRFWFSPPSKHKTQIDCFLCIVFRLVFISIDCLWFYVGYFYVQQKKTNRFECFRHCLLEPLCYERTRQVWRSILHHNIFFCDSILFIFIAMPKHLNWPFRSRLISYGFSITFATADESLLFAIPQVTIQVVFFSLSLFFPNLFFLSISRWNPITIHSVSVIHIVWFWFSFLHYLFYGRTNVNVLTANK